MTGGTTGQQAELYLPQESYNLKQAAAWRNETWMGRYPCDKIASLWPAHMDFHAGRSWKSRLKERYLLREIMYNTGYSGREILLEAHWSLRKFDPSFFRTFPSALGVYTDFLEKNGFDAPRLDGIMSTGEVLYPEQRRRFEQIYGCPVFDMYGTREAGNNASECARHEGRHISLETVLVEIVRDGVPLPAGQEGEMVITDLTNPAFPLIRYQINDRGLLKEQTCSCGRALPLMGPTVGRVQDDIWLPDGTRQSGLMIAVHLTADSGHKIGQTQIVQRSVTDFLIRITNKPEPDAETFAFLRRRMHEMLGDGITVDIDVVDEIPQEKSGKTRFVICQVTPPIQARGTD